MFMMAYIIFSRAELLSSSDPTILVLGYIINTFTCHINLHSCYGWKIGQPFSRGTEEKVKGTDMLLPQVFIH